MEDCGRLVVANPPSMGDSLAISAVRISFFHILLIPESFKFKSSSLVLVVHLDYAGMTGEHR